MACSTHPRYQAKRKPKSQCEECWQTWLAVQGGADLDSLLDGPSGEDLLKFERAKAESKAQARETGKMVKALEGELSTTRAQLSAVLALQAAPTGKPFKIVKPKGAGKNLPSAAYVALASDWHVGERVRPETVGHRNEYKPEIAEERGEKFFRSNLTMLNAARSAWDIRQFVLWLGGDLITGYIHDEYVEDNFISPTEESLLAFRMLSAGIKTLLAQSDCETILIPTSQGNHGRTTVKRRIATSHLNSFEWLLYQHLAAEFADEPRIKFQIADGYNNIVDLYGKLIRFHHGDAVGYAGGIGGLSIPMNRRIGRQASADGFKVMLDAIGHFHTLQFPKSFIGNGSLIGWNAFSETLGFGFEPPQQGSFVVDDRYGAVSNFNPIFVV